MCSAPYGRKKRPRSAGSIFPVSRGAHTEPERRESTEGAVDGSRMVSATAGSIKAVHPPASYHDAAVAQEGQ